MRKRLVLFMILLILGFFVFSHGMDEKNFLVSRSRTNDPLELMKVVTLSKKNIDDIEYSYENQWKKQREQIITSYQLDVERIEQQTPEIWETDVQFESRIKAEISELISKMESQLNTAFDRVEQLKHQDLDPYEIWFESAKSRLSEPKIVDSKIQIDALEFMRNERLWPLNISINHPQLHFDDLLLFVKFEEMLSGNDDDQKSAYVFEEGIYDAGSSFYDADGWNEYVMFKIEGGKIIDLYWDAFDRDWNSKSSFSRSGQYRMEKDYGSSSPWHIQAENAIEFLLANYSPYTISTMDDVSTVEEIPGVSIDVKPLFSLVREALLNGPYSYEQVREDERESNDQTIIATIKSEKENIDFRQEIIDFDQVVKQNQLNARVEWNITQNEEYERFDANLLSITIINTINGLEYETVFKTPLITNSYVFDLDTMQDIVLHEVKEISTIVDITTTTNFIFSPNKKFTPTFQFLPSHIVDDTYELKVIDEEIATVENNIITTGSVFGKTQLIFAANNGLFEKVFNLVVEYQVGDIGPSGGYIIYDSGDYSKGWRYIEASPTDAHNWLEKNDISWGDVAKYDNLSIKTKEGIGFGRDNTIKIANRINSDKNVAQIALDYEINGYDDWYLPSKDELDVLIGFYKSIAERLSGYAYWSSTCEGRPGFGESVAWSQKVSDQKQEEWNIYHTTKSIRPIRYF